MSNYHQAVFEDLRVKPRRVLFLPPCTTNFQFYLAAAALVSGEEQTRFQILLPGKVDLPEKEWMKPVLLAVALTGYVKNLSAQASPSNGQFAKGKRCYHPAHGVLEAKSGTASGVVFEKVFYANRNASKPEIFIENGKLSKCAPLPAKFDFRENSIEKLNECFGFFEKHLTDFRPLFDFPHKCLVLSSQAASHCLLGGIPARFNFDRHWQVPLPPLLEIVSDYQQVRDLLRAGDRSDVVVLGEANYRHCLGDLVNELHSGQRLLLVGTERVDASYGFKTWAWTESEILLLQKQADLPPLNLQSVHNASLAHHQKQFADFVRRWTEQGAFEPDLSKLAQGFLNFLCRLAAPVSQEKLLEMLLARLENATDLLENAFVGTVCSLRQVRQELTNMLKTTVENFDHGKFRTLIEDYTPEHDFFVVTEKWQAELLNAEFPNHRRHRHLAITPSELERMLASEDFSKNKSKKTHFLFTWLHFHPLAPTRWLRLCRRASDYAESRLLFYEGMENERIRRFQELAEREDRHRLCHPDREFFTSVRYEDFAPPPPAEAAADPAEQEALEFLETLSPLEWKKGKGRKLEDLFARWFGSLDDFDDPQAVEEWQANKTPASRTAAEHVQRLKFSVTFFDGDHWEWAGSQAVAKEVSVGKFTAVAAADLQAGDRVAVFEISYDNSHDVLSAVAEFKPVMREIEAASQTWREWLRWLRDGYKAKLKTDALARQELYEKLHLTVAISTLDRWLNDKEKFPRAIADLESILQRKIGTTPEADRPAVEAKAKQILDCRGGSAGFREVVTRLNDELSSYIVNGQKGEITARLSQLNMDKLLRLKTLKIIQTIIAQS